MSLDFDGVNDAVTWAAETLTDNFAFTCWFKADDQGESDAGALYWHGITTIRSNFRWDGSASSEKLQFTAGWTGTNGVWVMTSGFAAVGGWKWVLLDYSFSSSSNNPTLYTWDADTSTFSTLTVGSGLTESASPTTDGDPDGVELAIGGKGDGANSWNGLIAEAAFLETGGSVSEAEAKSILVNGVASVPRNNTTTWHLYVPLGDTGTAHALDVSGRGRDGTISGAVIGAENPPIRPAGRRG